MLVEVSRIKINLGHLISTREGRGRVSVAVGRSSGFALWAVVNWDITLKGNDEPPKYL